MIYFTELQNLPSFDARGDYLGRLADLAVDPSQNSMRVAAYHVRTLQKGILCITHEQMQSVSVRAAQTSVRLEEIRCYNPDESLISVKKDILDQQIIDVNNRKVERVNDVDFDIRPMERHTELRILAVNVGVAAAGRRLLQGLMAKHRIRSVTSLLPSHSIPWEFVNLIEPDPARRLKLRISYDRLAKLHPADIADILEELSRDEQKAVIESLDDETAAQAISEIPTRMQAVLLESIPAAKAADIVEEMPPDEAADVLQEMPPEASAEVLAGMETDEATEVRGLLGFEENTAGAMMTTEYITVDESATLAAAVEALKNFEGPPEAIHQIHLLKQDGALAGVAPLARILLADASTPLRDLSTPPVISVKAHADEKEVVDLFHKYNLVALPVVDDAGHVLGVVTADDVLEVVVKRR
ncbi:MAG TPA: CBS domain-containing protein [Terriglobia bacterium]|nr:CBS domain-containing protein [Terriglobia bacterium]